jgi:protein-L-isoaspartate O-methyltransferase
MKKFLNKKNLIIGGILIGIIILFSLFFPRLAVFIFLYLLLFILAAIMILDLSFLLPTIHGAIYIPSKNEKVEKMIRLANIKKGEKAVDLGSGDGRIVIALAKAGAEAHGYEISPLLVWKSRLNIRMAGLQGKAFIHFQTFWHANLSEYDVVTIFGISYIMNDLQKKLRKELKPGSRVIANAFPFKKWKYDKQDDEVYLYKIEKDLRGFD